MLFSKYIKRNVNRKMECFSVDKSKALSLVLHCCDISHPAKRWDLHHRWTSQLLEEFFRQGDKERELGLPFSPLCDRNNTLVAESQIGLLYCILLLCTNIINLLVGTDYNNVIKNVLLETKSVGKPN